MIALGCRQGQGASSVGHGTPLRWATVFGSLGRGVFADAWQSCRLLCSSARVSTTSFIGTFSAQPASTSSNSRGDFRRNTISSARFPLYLSALFLLCSSLMGCGVIKGIFKAGVWVGVLGVIVILGLVAFGASRLGR